MLHWSYKNTCWILPRSGVCWRRCVPPKPHFLFISKHTEMTENTHHKNSIREAWKLKGRPLKKYIKVVESTYLIFDFTGSTQHYFYSMGKQTIRQIDFNIKSWTVTTPKSDQTDYPLFEPAEIHLNLNRLMGQRIKAKIKVDICMMRSAKHPHVLIIIIYNQALS